MDSSARQKNRVTGSGCYPMKTIGDGTFVKVPAERFAGNPFFKADEELRARTRADDVPHFRFRLASQLRGFVGWRMNLQRKFFFGIKYLDEEGKSAFGRLGVPQ